MRAEKNVQPKGSQQRRIMKKSLLFALLLISCTKVVDNNASQSPISPGIYALAAECQMYIFDSLVTAIKNMPLLKLKSDASFERNPWCRVGGCGPTQYMVGGFVTALEADTTLEGSWFAKPDSLVLYDEKITPPASQIRYALPIVRAASDSFEVLDIHSDTSYFRKFFKIAGENASWESFTNCTLSVGQ
jgi:hypothetical protein